MYLQCNKVILMFLYRIIVDLLRLNVAPTAIERMLKSMTQQHSKKGQSGSMKMPLESGDNTTTVSSSRGRHSSSGSSSKSSRSSHRWLWWNIWKEIYIRNSGYILLAPVHCYRKMGHATTERVCFVVPPPKKRYIL